MTRFVVRSVEVVGVSMVPTLQNGDKCIVNRWLLLYRHPRPGELVVLKDPDDNFAVKRVIGGPRDIVLLHGDEVYVNGKKLDEPYLRPNTSTNNFEQPEHFAVGRDEYFVLGDNRKNSEDSRAYGAIPQRNILGLIGL